MSGSDSVHEDSIALMDGFDDPSRASSPRDDAVEMRTDKGLIPVVHRRGPTLLNRKLVITICIILGALIALVYGYVTITTPNEISSKTSRIRSSSNLYLVLSSSHKDTNVCKTILSAAILGYPAPRLVNWDPDLDRPEKDLERANQKMIGVNRNLDKLYGNMFENDTALVLGSQVNTWFQLRPEVFFERYYRIRARAIAHTGASPEHSVIFSARNVCPYYHSDPDSCYAALKEANIDEKQTPWASIDPRLAMGSVRAIKALYNDGQRLIAAANSTAHDEASVLNLLYQRQTREDTVSHGYSISLDYGGELSYTPPSHDRDSSFLDYGSMSDTSTSPYGLTAAIINSLPPFWTVWTSAYTSNLTWSSLSLLASQSSASEDPASSASSLVPATTNIPSLIQFSHAVEAARDSDRRIEWWSRMWFFTSARKLLTASTFIPTIPMSITLDEDESTERWVLNPSFVRAGIDLDGGKQMRWGEVCANYEDEIFSDGGGPWKDENTW